MHRAQDSHWAGLEAQPRSARATSKAASRKCAFARERRARLTPLPLKRAGSSRWFTDVRAPALRPSPTSRSNRAEAGEARPSGAGVSPRRSQLPPATPSTPAGSGGHAASGEVRHDLEGGLLRAQRRPWRRPATVKMSTVMRRGMGRNGDWGGSAVLRRGCWNG